jgi:hypothetical protein
MSGNSQVFRFMVRARFEHSGGTLSKRALNQMKLEVVKLEVVQDEGVQDGVNQTFFLQLVEKIRATKLHRVLVKDYNKSADEQDRIAHFDILTDTGSTKGEYRALFCQMRESVLEKPVDAPVDGPQILPTEAPAIMDASQCPEELALVASLKAVMGIFAFSAYVYVFTAFLAANRGGAGA